MADEKQAAALWLKQAAQKAERTGEAACGRFLPASEKPLAIHTARQYDLAVSFDGGWAEAERVQACFHPKDIGPTFNAIWLEIRWDARFSSLQHRDLLGSLMGLGIDRSHTGDLLLQGGDAPFALLYTLPAMAALLEREWMQAGRAALTVRRLDQPPLIQAEEGEASAINVPSLRLDAVLAAALHLSRAKAADMIRGELVQVNHLPQTRTDCVLRQGDLISIRGFGRVKVKDISAPTRKDRLRVAVEMWKR